MKLVLECGPCDGDYLTAIALAESLLPYRDRVAMKVQWYSADTLVAPGAERYDHTSGGPKTQHELFQSQLSYDEWDKVAEICRNEGLEFFPTVFDFEAVQEAAGMGISTLKIASGDITYKGLIEYAASMAENLIISTGASTAPEIANAVSWAMSANPDVRLTLLACHLAYPSRDEDANIARIAGVAGVLKQLGVEANVGYSDHTLGIAHAWILAVSASMWEKHYTLTPGQGGDSDFAITPSSIPIILDAIDRATTMLGSTELFPTEAESDALLGARRSLTARRDIARRTPLSPDDIAILRPGTGIAPQDLDKVLGLDAASFTGAKPMRAMVDIPAGTTITWPMVGWFGATLDVS